MRLRIDRDAVRELALTAGPAALLVVAAFALAWRFVEPPPPKTLVLAAATEGSIYYRFAERYREALAKFGIRVEIQQSQGSLDNLAAVTRER